MRGGLVHAKRLGEHAEALWFFGTAIEDQFDGCRCSSSLIEEVASVGGPGLPARIRSCDARDLPVAACRAGIVRQGAGTQRPGEGGSR
jgi:hypothetical protein